MGIVNDEDLLVGGLRTELVVGVLHQILFERLVRVQVRTVVPTQVHAGQVVVATQVVLQLQVLVLSHWLQARLPVHQPDGLLNQVLLLLVQRLAQVV